MTPETDAQARQSLDTWTDHNIQYIALLMETERQAIIRPYGASIPSYLDLSRRTLSEMPLCRWGLNINPPPGCRFVREGKVSLRLDGRFQTESHGFFYNSVTDNVVCFNTPIFIACDDETLKAGERINRMRELLPLSIQEYSNGIARLSGPRPLITRNLGLQFIVG